VGSTNQSKEGYLAIGTSTAPTIPLDVTGTANMTTLSIGGTAVTATAVQLNYVAGVTSAIQTQLNAKAPLASPTFIGNVTVPTPTVDTDAATKAYVDALTLNCTITSTSSTTFAYATCPAGTTRTGGGCVYALYQDASHYQYNRPVGDDQWECRGYPNYVVVAYIVCCDII